MSIILTRVDDRLIHGQTIIMWNKIYKGDATIILLPNKIFNDKFILSVIKTSGNALGEKLFVFGEEEAIERMPQAVASSKKYHIISKTIQELNNLSKNNIDFGNEIIFGTASQKENSVKIVNNVYIDKADKDACDYLMKKGINIIFKLIPHEKEITWVKIRNTIKL